MAAVVSCMADRNIFFRGIRDDRRTYLNEELETNSICKQKKEGIKTVDIKSLWKSSGTLIVKRSESQII